MTTSQWIEQAKTTLGNLVAVDVATRDARSRLISEVPNDWISVKDGLPEEGVRVLIACGEKLAIAKFVTYPVLPFPKMFALDAEFTIRPDNVDCWMPLPDAPKQEMRFFRATVVYGTPAFLSNRGPA